MGQNWGLQGTIHRTAILLRNPRLPERDGHIEPLIVDWPTPACKSNFRWNRGQKIISELHLPIQTVTYTGVAHNPYPALDDDIAFFKANDGDDPGTIAPR
jgi:hypothetical protein